MCGWREWRPWICRVCKDLIAKSIGLYRRDDDACGGVPGTHLHGVTHAPVRSRVSVSVIADHCVIADALTKVVLAGDVAIAADVLAAFDAQACVHDPVLGWSRLERAA